MVPGSFAVKLCTYSAPYLCGTSYFAHGLRRAQNALPAECVRSTVQEEASTFCFSPKIQLPFSPFFWRVAPPLRRLCSLDTSLKLWSVLLGAPDLAQRRLDLPKYGVQLQPTLSAHIGKL
ncbi:hypothetical protein N7510_006083 [Penicillium lagena]|uniref:uncharacterized protein n=1 Tax=Penicillium lagena TaxID=94218 RepID=UPI0025421F6D|nr:uncharacterized protein N7510_006083 [Penicillium lagena]KAJ5612889.1 hypothetical protein N7510_006083 [Penicillium lagena]